MGTFPLSILLLFLFFFYDVFKRITVFLIRYVLREYFLMSSLYNSAGYIIIFVQLLIPLVVGENILTEVEQKV